MKQKDIIIRIAKDSIVLNEVDYIMEKVGEYIEERLKEQEKKGLLLSILFDECSESELDSLTITFDEFPELFKSFKIIRGIRVENERLEIKFSKNMKLKSLSGSSQEIFSSLVCFKLGIFDKEEDGIMIEIDEFIKRVQKYAEEVISFFVKLDELIEERKKLLKERFEKSKIYEYLRKKEFERKLEV